MSTILVRGPFTSDELAKIISVVSGIEFARPDETFEIFVDDPQAEPMIDELMEKINPLRAGYERVVRYRHVKPRGKP